MRPRHIFAADIGGTSSRFASFIVDGNTLSCAKTVHLPTQASDSFPQLIDRAMKGMPPFSPDLAVLAVPGAVQAGRYATPANISWGIDTSTLSSLFPHTLLLNDFAAQAYACTTDIAAKFRMIKQGTAHPEGPLAIMGAGTGLGHCALVPDGYGGHVALPSEAGHGMFAFHGEHELEYQTFLGKERGKRYITVETVVSGRGLSRLHLFLTNEQLSPQEVARRFAKYPSTLSWFARLYGRACRQYCFSILATGGLYISGGLAVKNPDIIEHPAFISEFTDSCEYRDILENIPIFLNTDENIGMWGAAEYGRQHMTAPKYDV